MEVTKEQVDKAKADYWVAAAAADATDADANAAWYAEDWVAFDEAAVYARADRAAAIAAWDKYVKLKQAFEKREEV